MPYGIIKIDTVTFTDAGVDKSVTLSGLVQNPTFSGNVTVTGTLSGVTVTGTTANFTSGNFTNISGGTHTITSGVFAAGSAVSPSIAFAGDLNTGIYSPGPNQVAISTDGTGRLFVDASGNVTVDTNTFYVDATNNRVGIGTSTPSDLAHIYDTIGTTSLRLSNNSVGAQNSNQIVFESQLFNKTAFITHTANSSSNSLQIGGVTGLYFDGDQQSFRNASGTTRLFISTTGQVAFTKLLTASTPEFSFAGDPDTGIYSPGDNQLAITASGVERAKWGANEVVFNDGGANYDFRVEGDTNANLFFVDASTDRVGIGTTSPGSYLEVAHAGAGSANLRSVTFANGIGSSDFKLAAWTGVSTNNSGDVLGSLGLAFSTTKNSFINFHRGGGTTGGFMSFTVNNDSEAARIDSSGRLLVGTSSARGGWYNTTGTSASPIFQLDGTSFNTSSVALSTNQNSAVEGPRLLLGKSRGTTAGSFTVVQDGDDLGSIDFFGADGTNFVNGARIRAFVDGVPGADDLPTRLVFSTTADGASFPTERMHITSDGTIRLFNSPGIDFSQIQTNAAGMTSETLDSYEEGTWTPTAAQGFTSPTYGANTAGIYTKIGNIVRIHGRLVLTGGTATASTIRIGGLPFTCQNTASQYVTCAYYLNAGAGTVGNALKPLVTPGQTYIEVFLQNNTNVTGVAGTTLGNTMDILFSATYQV